MRRMYSKEQLIKLIQDNSSGGDILTATVGSDFDEVTGTVTISKTSLIISLIATVDETTGYQNQWMQKQVCEIDIPEKYRDIMSHSIVSVINEFKIPGYIQFSTNSDVGVNQFEYYADTHTLKIINFNHNRAITGTTSATVYISAAISLGGV